MADKKFFFSIFMVDMKMFLIHTFLYFTISFHFREKKTIKRRFNGNLLL